MRVVNILSWSNWNLELLVFVEEENRRTRRKTLGARREPTTNSTHIWPRGRNRTWATLVEGERSHHYAIPAPPRLGAWQEMVTWGPFHLYEKKKINKWNSTICFFTLFPSSLMKNAVVSVGNEREQSFPLKGFRMLPMVQTRSVQFCLLKSCTVLCGEKIPLIFATEIESVLDK